MGIQITTEPAGVGVTVKISADNEAELTNAVKKYVSQYPPMGYGTYVKDKYKQHGKQVCYLWRAASCD